MPAVADGSQAAWNFEIECDALEKRFRLKYNGVYFEDLKLQMTAERVGPQTIYTGLIKMNKEEVFRGSMQWSREEFKRIAERKLRGEPIKNLNINVDVPYKTANHA